MFYHCAGLIILHRNLLGNCFLGAGRVGPGCGAGTGCEVGTDHFPARRQYRGLHFLFSEAYMSYLFVNSYELRSVNLRCIVIR